MIRKATAAFAETKLDDELVLMNVDTGRFFALKGTGLEIWNLIDGSRDAPSLAEAMIQDYNVPPDACRGAIDRFIEQMNRAGFVEMA
jgi:hypothetical protein